MFVGRKEYLDDLSALWRKSTSSLVACRGRRRIGKSTLIAQFADDSGSHERADGCHRLQLCDIRYHDVIVILRMSLKVFPKNCSHS